VLDHLIEKDLISYHLDGNHGEKYPREEEFVSEGVPFLSANMISYGKIDLSKTKYVTEERARQFQKGIAKDGDVLLAHNATVGPVAILSTDLPYVILGTTLTSFRCNQSYLDKHYLRYFIEGPLFQQQLQRIMKQTTRNQVPVTAQRKLHFIVPAMDEQRKIAQPLCAFDEKLELERWEKSRLERIKQGLMDLLLTGKVRVKVD
jgi:type I restriction enzyme S subunit